MAAAAVAHCGWAGPGPQAPMAGGGPLRFGRAQAPYKRCTCFWANWYVGLDSHQFHSTERICFCDLDARLAFHVFLEDMYHILLLGSVAEAYGTIGVYMYASRLHMNTYGCVSMHTKAYACLEDLCFVDKFVYTYLIRYPMFYMQYANIPTRDSPHPLHQQPMPLPPAASAAALACGGMG